MYKVFIDNKSQIFDVQDEKLLLEKFADHLYIEAAGGIVQQDDKYLFIHRNGCWDIPKGKLESGELPEEGALREIEEECGVSELTIKEHLVNTWHTYEHKGKKVLKKTFWYWVSVSGPAQHLTPQTEEGITEVKWFTQNDFSKISQETYLSIVEVIEALKIKLQKKK